MIRTLLGTNLLIEQKGRQAFNLDTVLLQSFIKVPVRAKTVLDLGTGIGPLMLYVSQKTKAKIIGVEIQETRYLQALKNIELNQLQHQLSCLHLDINDLKMKDVDVIVSNPPFFKVSESSNLNETEEDTIARHEVKLSLNELIEKVSKTLKYGGYFYMIHRPDRLMEILSLCEENHLAIKRIRFVHPYLNHEANHVLIEAMKYGSSGIKVEKPLILYKDKHLISEEMENIYQGG
ncbi:MAG: methyltransferase [Acholeplasmataceae bacterium]|jgi:tRNA1(Val) A37 N6-methylase TrmN6|nr:methyltransferase [Acholeplasmataceae bacterium]